MTASAWRPSFELDPLIAEAKRRARQRRVLVALCILLLAGLAGGLTLAFRSPGRGGRSRGSHIYLFAPEVGGSLAKGIVITVVSPVAIPTWPSQIAKDWNRGVGHASGPQACSYTKHVHGLHGRSASLNGKTVTVTVNGSNPAVGRICSGFQKSAFTPANA